MWSTRGVMDREWRRWAVRFAANYGDSEFNSLDDSQRRWDTKSTPPHCSSLISGFTHIETSNQSSSCVVEGVLFIILIHASLAEAIASRSSQ
jgi:hypothetical protein